MRNYRQENRLELLRIKNEKKRGSDKNTEPLTEAQQKRRNIIRLIAAAVALVVASVSFATFAKQCTQKTPGLQTVSTDPDADAMLYAAGITFDYDFQGSSNEIRVQMNALRVAYSRTLAYIYKMLDPVNLYDEYTNLAYVNAHPGEEIKVPNELYWALSSAYELTQRGEANVFGGVLFNEWKSITVLNDSAESDPLLDEDERERIAEIASMTADLNNFGLELRDGNVIVFTVSEEYRAMMERLEIEAPVLDLGILREAYEIDYTASALEKSGYTRGFITTDSGMTRCLSESEGGYIVTYHPANGVIADAYKVPMTPGRMCCTFRTYPYGEDDIEYYTISVNGEERMRHPHYDLETGEVYDALITVTVSAENADFAALCSKCYALVTAPTAEAAENELSQLDGFHAAFVTRAEPTVVIADKAFAELVPSVNMTLRTK